MSNRTMGFIMWLIFIVLLVAGVISGSAVLQLIGTIGTLLGGIILVITME